MEDINNNNIIEGLGKGQSPEIIEKCSNDVGVVVSAKDLEVKFLNLSESEKKDLRKIRKILEEFVKHWDGFKGELPMSQSFIDEVKDMNKTVGSISRLISELDVGGIWVERNFSFGDVLKFFQDNDGRDLPNVREKFEEIRTNLEEYKANLEKAGKTGEDVYESDIVVGN